MTNSNEITVNGVLDEAELLALRQFEQIVENKKDYEDKLTEVITDGKGISDQPKVFRVSRCAFPRLVGH
ncbi:MAG: hypothetical protein V5B31_14840 [Candidatus Accumulibacter propinquus]|uniref:hypothetical protein n=1 Tax=Candidatus Accumulibacter propinquus TaxID=2954380 RepID=UPI002FC3D76D